MVFGLVLAISNAYSSPCADIISSNPNQAPIISVCSNQLISIISPGAIASNIPNESGIDSTGDNVTITNSGTITVSGFGIKADGLNSTNMNSGQIITNEIGGVGIATFYTSNYSANTNSGAIETFGINGHGIYSGSQYSNNSNFGTIITRGLYSLGIASGFEYSTNTNSGTITNYSDEGAGIRSAGFNSTNSNLGTITTSGNSGDGIYSLGADTITTNSGVIIVTGANSRGIVLAGNNQTFTNSGLVMATGTNSNAIRWDLGVSNGVVNLNRGSVIIGDMVAEGHENARLNINLGSGASYAYSVSSNVLVSDLNGRPMVTGSAHAAGIGNVSTASQSLYERTSQITQSLDDRVRTYDAKQNTSQDFWVNTYYSDSNRGGQGLSGSNLSFNQYRSGITAGFNVKNSYTTTELIVNYEHGKLNIDEGNQGISSNSVMAGALFPDIKKLFTGTLSAKALIGYSDFSGDRKVLTNDVALNGSRNVTANYQSSHLTIGSAWTKTLYQTDKMILDTLVGVDLNTQHINSYSESDLFKWNGRTINQLQERVTLGMEIKPLVKPLTLFGRVGIERRDLISGENQNYAINNTAVSYNDSNQRNTYATLNAGAYYPLTPTVKAYAQVRYYDSVKDIDSLSGSIGISGQF